MCQRTRSVKTPFCEVYVARGFCRLKPLETRPNVRLTIITITFLGWFTISRLMEEVLKLCNYAAILGVINFQPTNTTTTTASAS